MRITLPDVVNSKYSFALVWAIAFAGVLIACAPAPRGACDGDGDCRAGTVCDAELGYCVDATCSLECGPGFTCIRSEGAERCENNADSPGLVRMLSIEPEHSALIAPTEFRCEARAPQLVDVRFRLDNPQGGSERVPGVAEDGDRFSAIWEAPGTVKDGRWSAVCEAVFGPEGAQLLASSEPRPFIIDRTAPSIEHEPPSGWFSAARSVELRATVVDPPPANMPDGASGVARVWLELPNQKPMEPDEVEVDADEWRFHVDVSGVEGGGPVRYAIAAEDRAGNIQRTSDTLQVDNRTPVITAADEGLSNWQSPAAGIEILATITTAPDGAPLDSESIILILDGDPAVSISAELKEPNERLWAFFIPPESLEPTSSEPAPDMVEMKWTIHASTIAGAAASASGLLRLDKKGPLFTVDAPAWMKRGDSATISGTVEDSGCGVDDGGFDVSSTLGEPECEYAAGAFSCALPTTDAPAEVVSLVELSVSATDTCGNAETILVEVGVDDEDPKVIVPADEDWKARLAPLSIHAEITDTGAGLASEPPVLETIAAPGVTFASTTGVQASGDGWVFVLEPRNFLDSDQMYPALGLRLTVSDAVGNITTKDFIRAIDGQGPSFDVTDLDEVPILRNADPLLLEFTLHDQGRDASDVAVPGVGVDLASVLLAYRDHAGVDVEIPAEKDGERFTVPLDPSQPLFEAANGSMALELRARDLLGNETSHPFSVEVTRELWEFDSESSTSVVSSPALADGTLIFSLSANGLNSITDNLFAIDAKTGARLWSARVPGTPTTPVALGDEAAYVAFVDGLGEGHVAAYPLNPTDEPVEPLWMCEGVGAIEGALGLAWWMWGGVERETVMAASGEKRILAILANAAACDVYASPTFSEDTTGALISVDGQRAWFGGADGTTGFAEFVTHPIASDVTILSTSPGAAFVAGVGIESSGRAFSIHPGTLRRWTDDGPDYESSPAADTFTSVAPPSIGSDGAVWFGTAQGRVYRFDPPSTIASAGFPITSIDADPIRSAPTIDSKGNVYLVTRSGVVRAHASDGQRLWSFATGSGNVTSSSPVLGCDGILYVGTSNGRVVALVTDGDSLADAPWPRFQHDNRNTGNAATSLRVGGECID